MKINFKVVCRTSRGYKNNTAPIFIRLIQGKKAKFISTGVAVNPDYWDFNEDKLTADCPNREHLQVQIDDKLEALNRQIAKLEILEMDVTLDTLIGNKKKQINPTLRECFEREIKAMMCLHNVQRHSTDFLNKGEVRYFNLLIYSTPVFRYHLPTTTHATSLFSIVCSYVKIMSINIILYQRVHSCTTG